MAIHKGGGKEYINGVEEAGRMCKVSPRIEIADGTSQLEKRVSTWETIHRPLSDNGPRVLSNVASRQAVLEHFYRFAQHVDPTERKGTN